MNTARHLEEAAEWSLRMEEGEADPQAFDVWLAAHAENRKAYESLNGTLESVDRYANAPEIVNLRGEALVAARRSHDVIRAKAFFTSRLGIAASIAVLAFVLGVAGIWSRLQAHSFATGVGERRTFALGDGSRLTLDAASRVTVHYSQERRRVTLEHGRARFDVAKDPLRPFMVESGGKLVVAIGTSFSVELVRQQLHVVLYEGRVEVLRARETEGAHWTLQPGNELVAATDESRKPVRIARVDKARAVAWESGELAFADEPLGVAVERVNRYSSRHLKVGDAATAEVRISGVFHAGDTEAFIDGISLLFPVVAQRNEKGATFRLRETPSR